MLVFLNFLVVIFFSFGFCSFVIVLTFTTFVNYCINNELLVHDKNVVTTKQNFELKS